MRPKIFRSRTEMRAKMVRKTPSNALILIRIDTMVVTQSGVPESNDRIHCFALTKIWSSDWLTLEKEKR